MLSVGIYVFDQVEVLDFTGPFEVFSVSSDEEGLPLFKVELVSQSGDMITAVGGLKVVPDYSIVTAPQFDILIIPGGYGARVYERNKPIVLEWVRAQSQQVEVLASVCTGAFILAEAGLLTGLDVTTHWAHTNRLEESYSALTVLEGVKYVDQGKIITSAGISAGINMTFYLIERLYGNKIALETAKRMEYDIDL